MKRGNSLNNRVELHSFVILLIKTKYLLSTNIKFVQIQKQTVWSDKCACPKILEGLSQNWLLMHWIRKLLNFLSLSFNTKVGTLCKCLQFFLEVAEGGKKIFKELFFLKKI